MNKNIFEGAKFGDKFAIQYTKIPFVVFLNVEYISDDSKEPEYRCANNEWSPSILCYDKTGKCLNAGTRYDIVSRYQDTIDEEKLDELARETYSEEYIEIPYHDYVDSEILRIGFKTGFRKAKEEE